ALGPRRRRLEQLDGTQSATEPLLVGAERSRRLEKRAVRVGRLERHVPRLEVLGRALVEREGRAALTVLDRVLHGLEVESVPALAARSGVADELLDDTAGTEVMPGVPLGHLLHDQPELRGVPQGRSGE